jgi:hypothetical protein
MKKAVMCIVDRHGNAESIVRQLKGAGFFDTDISVLFPDKEGTRDFAHEYGTKAPEGAVAGAGAGSVVGGTLGLLAGVGALAIPGLGPLIAAGPLLSALSGVAAGAAVGGLAGGLVGMGVPEIEAKRYEGKVRGGNILISVHTESSGEREVAEDIFRGNHADDICTAWETSAPKDAPRVAHP